jgi:D-arabinose 1-dehydrogenase-like Zn-dependent alcohol dehydrogenase
MALAGRGVCVLGGAGALGNACLAWLKAAGATTTCVDYRESAMANRNLKLSVTADWKKQASKVAAALREQHTDGIDMLLCTGTWIIMQRLIYFTKST